jgi:hypothetical protein
VVVGVVFERFPASVRGAVVIRGADPDPHQVHLEAATVVEAHGTGRVVRPVDMEAATVDVAPRGEVLIPFDVAFADLDPGWYALAAEVVVDGVWRVRGPEEPKRFSVPWPGGEVRRGQVPADVALGRNVVVEAVECRADRAVVRWRQGGAREEPGPPTLRVLADGRRLPELDAHTDPSTEARTTVVYPILKANRELTFELERRGAGRGRPSATLPLG